MRFAAQMGPLFSTKCWTHKVFNRSITTKTHGNSPTHPLNHTICTLTCLIHILHDICTDTHCCCSNHSHLLINDKCPCPTCETRRFLQLSDSLSPNQCVLLLYSSSSVYCKSSWSIYLCLSLEEYRDQDVVLRWSSMRCDQWKINRWVSGYVTSVCFTWKVQCRLGIKNHTCSELVLDIKKHRTK